MTEPYVKSTAASAIAPESLAAARVLDMIVQLRQVDTLRERVMALANQLASWLDCPVVAIGWLQGNSLRLQGMNEKARLRKQAEKVQMLETAMEVCLDYNDELRHPPMASHTVVLEMQQIALANGLGHAWCLPLRENGQPVGAILLQRDGKAFTDAEAIFLRLLADQTTPFLAESFRHSAVWPVRIVRHCDAFLRRRWALRHFWTNAAALGVLALLLLVMVPRWPYALRAAFVVQAIEQATVSAPRDGFIEMVAVRIGEDVSADEQLLRMDAAQTAVELAYAEAAHAVSGQRSNEARQRRDAAAAAIADAMAQQTAAQQELIRHRLVSSSVTAPFAGRILEDHQLHLRVGGPVQLGEPLFVIAMLDAMEFAIKVPERDYLAVRATGDVSVVFVSEPQQRFAITGLRWDPATSDEGEQSFVIARGRPAGVLPEWVRPGMRGTAYLATDDKTLFWIVTHRLRQWWAYHSPW